MCIILTSQLSDNTINIPKINLWWCTGRDRREIFLHNSWLRHRLLKVVNWQTLHTKNYIFWPQWKETLHQDGNGINKFTVLICGNDYLEKLKWDALYGSKKNNYLTKLHVDMKRNHNQWKWHRKSELSKWPKLSYQKPTENLHSS